MTKKKAIDGIVEHILCCENGEYESYVTYCEDNEYNPHDINGLEQSKHIYAMALIVSGLKFPE